MASKMMIMQYFVKPLARKFSGAPIVKPVSMLVYTFVENMAEKRTPYRPAHLQAVNDAADRGELILGGAFEEMDGGVLMFTTPETAEKFALNDPYVTEELVQEFNIRNLSIVGGTVHKHL